MPPRALAFADIDRTYAEPAGSTRRAFSCVDRPQETGERGLGAVSPSRGMGDLRGKGGRLLAGPAGLGLCLCRDPADPDELDRQSLGSPEVVEATGLSAGCMLTCGPDEDAGRLKPPAGDVPGDVRDVVAHGVSPGWAISPPQKAPGLPVPSRIHRPDPGLKVGLSLGVG